MNKILLCNRKIEYKYNINGKLECGMILNGSEVKYIKAKEFNLSNSYIIFKKIEMFLIGLKFSKDINYINFSPLMTRSKKLIAHKKEINTIYKKYIQKGISIFPIKIYTKKNLVKILIGWGQMKNKTYKKEFKKHKDIKLNISRIVKRNIYRMMK